jgi:hypothetical protein
MGAVGRMQVCLYDISRWLYQMRETFEVSGVVLLMLWTYVCFLVPNLSQFYQFPIYRIHLRFFQSSCFLHTLTLTPSALIRGNKGQLVLEFWLNASKSGLDLVDFLRKVYNLREIDFVSREVSENFNKISLQLHLPALNIYRFLLLLLYIILSLFNQLK